MFPNNNHVQQPDTVMSPQATENCSRKLSELLHRPPELSQVLQIMALGTILAGGRS